MSAGNGLPAHLYSQSSYRATAADFSSTEKVSPMHYTNAYAGHQTTAVDLYTDLYNGYSTCGQNTEFSNELPTMDMSSVYNVNNYPYEAHKFNAEHSAYFDSEKKFDVGGGGGGGVDSSRNICVQNGYMNYNNCWLARI